MLEGKIEIKYKTANASHHYEITPYVFAPKLAKRVVSKSYFDLGQGILELMNSLHEKNSKKS